MKGVLTLLLTLMALGLAAQIESNKRIKEVYNLIEGQTYFVDTLSIVWSSFEVYHKKEKLDSNHYDLSPLTSMVTFKGDFDTLIMSYRVFNFGVKTEYYTIDSSYISPDPSLALNPFRIIGETQQNNPWSESRLDKNGSLSRGISFGNNQDMNVSSNMNIQLNGKISEDISIKASINDESIPFQPEGNTQKLQEFDKVFIELEKGPYKLIAGDYYLTERGKRLMSFDKKAQGLSFRMQNDSNRTHFSAAVSRGKFARNLIQGVEGNQGPYRLTGAQNELFIIILSGTERIFIDGILLERGMNKDYIIDYNTSEITFTANQLITKDKRIIAEFQYSDQRYSRSLFYFNQTWLSEKWDVSLGLYSEQDSKNQPLQQTLSSADKQILSNAGDNLLSAFTPNIDSVGYSNTEVLYAKIDTTIGLTIYSDVFINSANPDSALYRLGFSYVGSNKGNYLLANSGTNGRVYQWVQPLNGEPQGDYEPIVLLLPPEKKQVIDVKGNYKIKKGLEMYGEGAISNNDINTFSELDKSDNVGSSLIYGLRQNKKRKENGMVFFNDFSYQFIQSEFSSIERVRSVEFSRDWNINQDSLTNDDHIVNWITGVKNKNNLFQIGGVYYYHQDALNAAKVSTKVNWRTRNQWYLKNDGSFTVNSINGESFQFARHKSVLSKGLGPIKIQIKDEMEWNVFGLSGDSLSQNSYSFNHWRASVLSNDTIKNKWELYYGGRVDKRSNQVQLLSGAIAEEFGGEYSLVSSKSIQFKLNTAYRNLDVLDTNLIDVKADQSFLNRANMRINILNGFVSSNLFYELGSGQELKREFYYLQVPIGSGTHTWVDYNGNNIQELNEFEIAIYQDQSEYIKVWRPTNEYISTYSNQFNQSFNIDPARLIKTSEGFKGFVRRFKNQFSYRAIRKTVETDYWSSSNPFNNSIVDSNLINISSSMRNVLFFNQSNPWFGMDYTQIRRSSKTLLTNGFNGRSLWSNELNVRWNFSKKSGVRLENSKGLKRSTSDFFERNNYLIDQLLIAPQFFYQPNVFFRVSWNSSFSEKRNIYEGGYEFFKSQKTGVEFRYNSSKAGSLSGGFNYALVNFNGEENTPIAYDMLEGLKSGKNFLWNLQIQKNLNKSLQLSVQYNGRKTGTNQVIHNGGMQLRALF